MILLLGGVTAAYKPDAPVIGVLTYPGAPSLLDGCVGAAPCSALQLAVQKESAYVESSYARWLQMAGARVVPIDYDLKPAMVRQLFSKLNGVLFTGGPAKPLEAPKPYFATATLLYGLVFEAWKQGDFVPLWGTCLGLQTISCIAAGGRDVLGDFPLENYAYPLDFSPHAAGSRLFGGMSASLRHDFEQNVTTNWHHYGVGPDALPAALQPLATNRALNGATFVSALEGRDGLPVFATQFHPESVQWNGGSTDGVPARSAAAVRTVQYLANFFVDLARNNSHAFGSAREEALALISQQGRLQFDEGPAGGDLYPEGAYLFPKGAGGGVEA